MSNTTEQIKTNWKNELEIYINTKPSSSLTKAGINSIALLFLLIFLVFTLYEVQLRLQTDFTWWQYLLIFYFLSIGYNIYKSEVKNTFLDGNFEYITIAIVIFLLSTLLVSIISILLIIILGIGLILYLRYSKKLIVRLDIYFIEKRWDLTIKSLAKIRNIFIDKEISSKYNEIIIEAYASLIENNVGKIEIPEYYQDYLKYFSELNMQPTQDLSEIKCAYRKQMIKYHPTKYQYLGEIFVKQAEKKIQIINDAYQSICSNLNTINLCQRINKCQTSEDGVSGEFLKLTRKLEKVENLSGEFQKTLHDIIGRIESIEKHYDP